MYIGSSFFNDSKTISVHCSVIGNKRELIDGMNITGTVSLNNITTPAVPNNAIVNADGKYYIFIVSNKKVEEHIEKKAMALRLKVKNITQKKQLISKK